jgi:hypothetical protein
MLLYGVFAQWDHFSKNAMEKSIKYHFMEKYKKINRGHLTTTSSHSNHSGKGFK